MRVTRRVTAAAFGTALALAGFTGGAAAHADNTAVQLPDYVSPPPAVVAGEVITQAPSAPTETAVSPAEVSRGELPITGGDTVGLAVAGLGMLGVGAALVRRNRRHA